MSESPEERKIRLANQLAPWRAHVEQTRADNPNMSYKDVLTEASRTNPDPKYQKTASANPKGPYAGTVGQHRGVSLGAAKNLFRSHYRGKSTRSMRADLSRARKEGRVLTPCTTRKDVNGREVCIPRKNDTEGAKRSYLYRRSNGPAYYDMAGLDDGSLIADRKNNKGVYRKIRTKKERVQAGGAAAAGAKPTTFQPLGMNGSACIPLRELDCAKHPACTWRKYGRAKSKSCGRKPSPRTKKMKGGMSDYEE